LANKRQGRDLAAELQSMFKAKFPQHLEQASPGGYPMLPGSPDTSGDPDITEAKRRRGHFSDYNTDAASDSKSDQVEQEARRMDAEVDKEPSYTRGKGRKGGWVKRDKEADKNAAFQRRFTPASPDPQPELGDEMPVGGRSAARSSKAPPSDRIRESERGGHRLGDTRAGRGPSRVAAALKMIGL